MTKYLQDTPLAVDQAQASLFSTYSAEQRTTRGLGAGDSLDVEATTKNGIQTRRVLPLAEAVTRRYADPIIANDLTLAALPLDDYAQTKVAPALQKDEAQLDPKIQAKIQPAAPGKAQVDAKVADGSIK